jgi:hypothetical protein
LTRAVSTGDVSLLLSYAKWGSLTACGASALVSGGMLAIGQQSNRPEMADKGKRALRWSLGGGAVTVRTLSAERREALVIHAITPWSGRG